MDSVPEILLQQALEQAIRADEKANHALQRLTSVEANLITIGSDVSDLKVQIGKLVTKNAIAAAVGSLVGGGAIAVLVTLLTNHHP